MDLLGVLRASGVTALDRRVKSRPGAFTPAGVVLHHTASALGMDPMPSLRICQKGRPDLPGPLCNVLVGRDASVAVVTDGRANDTGGGDPHVLAAVRSGQAIPAPDDSKSHRVDGNPWFYDVEVENDGVGEPWSDRVISASVLVAVALCRAHGWPADRVICHREWTRRKIDPSWRGPWRALIAKKLTATPPEDDMAAVILRVGANTPNPADDRYAVSDYMEKRPCTWSEVETFKAAPHNLRVVDIEASVFDAIPVRT